MQLFKMILVSGSVFVLLGNRASAQTLVVETWSVNTRDSQVPYSSPATVVIPLTSTTDRINMYSTGGLATIGAISFTGSTSVSSVDVIIGSGPLNTNRLFDLSNSAQDWNGVTFPFNARLSGAIAGNLTGSVNPVSIVRLEVHGELSAPITTSAFLGDAIQYLQFGASTAAGTISCSGGNILTIEALSNSNPIRGAITVPSGSIADILAPGGINIASSDGIKVRDGITSIIAKDTAGTPQPVSANIQATPIGGGGNLFHLEAASLDKPLRAYNFGTIGGGHTATEQFMVSGTVSAPITFEGDVGDSIHVGNFSSGGAVIVHRGLTADVISDGSIPYLQVDGHIGHLGNHPVVTIAAMDGSIGEISAGDMEIDTLAGVAHVWIKARTKIGTLKARTLAARVSDIFGNRIQIDDLRTYAANPNPSSFDGFIYGDISCESFQSFRVDLATVPFSVFDRLNLGELKPADTLQIGWRMELPILMPTAHHHGQIVIGADPANYLTTWDSADVIIGTQTLSPIPYYHNLSSLIGGGGVGSVPYHLHSYDCEPPNGSQLCAIGVMRLWPDGTLRETIVLRHYGRVFDAHPGDSRPPLDVYWSDIACQAGGPCPPPFGNPITSQFDILVRPPVGTNRATEPQQKREIWVARKLSVQGAPQSFEGNHRYKVDLYRPSGQPADLRCDDTFSPTTASAPAVFGCTSGSCTLEDGYPYIVMLFCEDMNLSGLVDVEDVALWIDTPVDFTNDGVADIDDLAEVINALGTSPR